MTRAGRSRLLRELGVFAAFGALTVAMTWPWVTHIRDAASDAGDPYLVAWILAWDFHQTFRDPLRLFQANIFFPYSYTLAFSENLYGLAVLLFPLLALGLPPLGAQSVGTLLGFTFCGYGAFRLTRTLTGSTAAGWIAGIGFAFVPYRFHQLPHLPYLFAGWIPILLEALVLYLRAPTRKRAAWLGAAFLMNALTSIHWFVLTLVPLACTSAALLFRYGRAREAAVYRRAAAALAVAGLLLAPFLIPYQRAATLYGFVRNEADARAFSAHLVHWITADPKVHLWRGLGVSPVPGELALFPGLGLLLLPLVALLLSRRKPDVPDAAPAPQRSAGTRSDALLVGGLWAAIGFAGSFGLNGPFHRALWDFVPLFRSVRVPARWAMLCDLGLALLAGYGAMRLAEAAAARFPRRRAIGTGVVVVLALALLFEQRVVPWTPIHGDADPDPVTLRLKVTPMRGGLVELPAGGSRGNHRHVLRAADHWKPLVNAISGFSPPEVVRLERLLDTKPIPDKLMTVLEKIPASYVVLHGTWIGDAERRTLHAFLARQLNSGRLRFIRRFGPRRDDLYAVVRTEPDARAEAVLPWTPVEDDPARAEREDGSITGSVDDPAEGAVVDGNELLVRGWTRVPGEDPSVQVFLDGELRTPKSAVRAPRPDVAAAIPALGDTSRAGYEARFTFLEGDAGRHEILVVFHAADGRVRHHPIRSFTWRPR